MEKEQFGSRLGFILVSAGCAIGLGNVWKFPYICGENGGAAFIVIYLACLAMMGLPMLICEYAVGRGSGKSVMKAYDVLQPEGTLWSKVKHFCFAGNYLLMMFYTMVAGWMLHYVYLMITGKFVNADTAQVKNTFANNITDFILKDKDVKCIFAKALHNAFNESKMHDLQIHNQRSVKN